MRWFNKVRNYIILSFFLSPSFLFGEFFLGTHKHGPRARREASWKPNNRKQRGISFSECLWLIHNPSAAPSTYYERGFLFASHPLLALPNPNAHPEDVYFLCLGSRPKWMAEASPSSFLSSTQLTQTNLNWKKALFWGPIKPPLTWRDSLAQRPFPPQPSIGRDSTHLIIVSAITSELQLLWNQLNEERPRSQEAFDSFKIELDFNVSSERFPIMMATFSGYNHGYPNKPPMMSSRIFDTSTTTIPSLNMKAHTTYLLPLSPIWNWFM